MTNLQKHEYKNSGIKWIGKIPKNWEIYRIKDLTKLQTGGTPKNNEGVTEENTNISWFTPSDFIKLSLDKSEQYITKDIVKKDRIKLYPKKSILFVGIASIGKIAITEKESYSNQQITALISKHSDAKFLTYSLLACSDYVKDNALYTVVAIVNNLELGQYKLAIPTNIKEQEKIVNYLDKKCENIDNVIEKAKKQIELLKEYKQSVITEAVTKGLDKSVELKDSGIKWIGKIPKHWKISKIKYEYDIQTGATPDTTNQSFYEGENIWVSIDDMNEKFISDSKAKITQEAIKSCRMEISPKGSLLFSFKLSVGKVSFCSKDLYTNEAIATFFSNTNSLEFLYYTAPIFIVKNANKNIYGANLLNQQLIKDAIITIPPLTEQKKIADYFDKKCSHIDETIEKKEQLIEKFKEYKKSLIYECVTGKKQIV